MNAPASTQKLTRLNVATLMDAIRRITQARVAELSGVSETKVSRMHVPQATKEGGDDRSDIERFCALLSACNLVLVPRTHRAVDPDEWQAMAILARKAIHIEARGSGQDAVDSGMGEL